MGGCGAGSVFGVGSVVGVGGSVGTRVGIWVGDAVGTTTGTDVGRVTGVGVAVAAAAALARSASVGVGVGVALSPTAMGWSCLAHAAIDVTISGISASAKIVILTECRVGFMRLLRSEVVYCAHRKAADGWSALGDHLEFVCRRVEAAFREAGHAKGRKVDELGRAIQDHLCHADAHRGRELEAVPGKSSA